MCSIRIYAAREGLNSRVASMLQAPDAPATEVAAALADLKENLSAEMRAVSEQHFLLLRMLLSPTQVAHPCRAPLLPLCAAWLRCIPLLELSSILALVIALLLCTAGIRDITELNAMGLLLLIRGRGSWWSPFPCTATAWPSSMGCTLRMEESHHSWGVAVTGVFASRTWMFVSQTCCTPEIVQELACKHATQGRSKNRLASNVLCICQQTRHDPPGGVSLMTTPLLGK